MNFSRQPPWRNTSSSMRPWKARSMRHDLLRRHVLGQRGEADEVGEEHPHRLPAHAAQRLVALGQHVDDLGREVAGEVAARPLGLGPLGHEAARAPHEQGQAGTDQQEHDDLVRYLRTDT